MLVAAAIKFIFLTVIGFMNRNRLPNTKIFLCFLALKIVFDLHTYLLFEFQQPELLLVFFNHTTPLGFLQAPLLFLYVRNTLQNRKGLSRWDMLHSLPFLVALADFLPYTLSSLDTKRVIIAQIISNLNDLRVYGSGWIFSHYQWSMFRWLSWFIYLICIVFLLYEHCPEKDRFLNFFKKTTNISYVWLFTLTGTIACLLPFYLFQIINFNLGNIDLNTASYTHSPAFLTGVIIYGLACLIPLFFPQILYGVNWAGTVETQPYLDEMSSSVAVKINGGGIQSQITTATSKKVQPNALAQLAIEIKDYIDSERPYLDLDFSISTISRHLQVPEHQVNACFSNHFSLGFPAYRNKLRIEYALLLMQRGMSSELTLDAIGTRAGFRSKPIFYAAFRKETGKTPGAYLDHLMSGGGK